MKILGYKLIAMFLFVGHSKWVLAADQERNPFAITSALMKILTETPMDKNQNNHITRELPVNSSIINGLPHIRLQAVSFTKDKRSALLEKQDGSTLLVAEGDRLYLIEQGEYVEMNVLEIKPRSIMIQLGPQGQIIEVQ